MEGVVFEDKDGDGVYSEGDEYLAGVTVTITDSAGNVYTVVTDTGGSYSQQVAPGDTTMTFTSALLDRLQQTTGASAVNVPSGGTTNTSVAFLVPSYVEGEVFEDVDGDGVYGIGDLYISGVNILITDSLGREYTVVTDANGYYKQQVAPGETTVSIEAVSNAISSPPPLPPAPPSPPPPPPPADTQVVSSCTAAGVQYGIGGTSCPCSDPCDTGCVCARNGGCICPGSGMGGGNGMGGQDGGGACTGADVQYGIGGTSCPCSNLDDTGCVCARNGQCIYPGSGGGGGNGMGGQDGGGACTGDSVQYGIGGTSCPCSDPCDTGCVCARNGGCICPGGGGGGGGNGMGGQDGGGACTGADVQYGIGGTSCPCSNLDDTGCVCARNGQCIYPGSSMGGGSGGGGQSGACAREGVQYGIGGTVCPCPSSPAPPPASPLSTAIEAAWTAANARREERGVGSTSATTIPPPSPPSAAELEAAWAAANARREERGVGSTSATTGASSSGGGSGGGGTGGGGGNRRMLQGGVGGGSGGGGDQASTSTSELEAAWAAANARREQRGVSSTSATITATSSSSDNTVCYCITADTCIYPGGGLPAGLEQTGGTSTWGHHTTVYVTYGATSHVVDVFSHPSVCDANEPPSRVIYAIVHGSEDSTFWEDWGIGASNGLPDTAELQYIRTNYDASMAAQYIEEACDRADGVVMTVPYAEGSLRDRVVDAINSCMARRPSLPFTLTNTDTAFNLGLNGGNDLWEGSRRIWDGFVGSGNFAMGRTCGRLFSSGNLDLAITGVGLGELAQTAVGSGYNCGPEDRPVVVDGTAIEGSPCDFPFS